MSSAATEPRRLVRVAEFQRPPAPGLRVLRKLDPTLEMVSVGQNVWFIGTVKRQSAACLEGRRRRASIQAHLAEGGTIRRVSFWKAELMAQGFRNLTVLTTSMPTPSQCYAAVRPLLSVTPVMAKQAWAESLRASDGTVQREESKRFLEDYIPKAGEDSHRHAFRPPIFALPAAKPTKRSGVTTHTPE